MKNKYLIFDLDDTLYYEVDYLRSAYREIAGKLSPDKTSELFEEMMDLYLSGENVFLQLTKRFTISVSELLNIYRNHRPSISVSEGFTKILKVATEKGYKLGLVTDGRSVTQRNKLKALGLEGIFNPLVISEEFGSEKPSIENFKVFMTDDHRQYFYIGNDTSKDFLGPNKLGWTTICLLDHGKNIKKQDFKLDSIYLPKYRIQSLNEILSLL